MKRNILLCVAGLTPQIIMETLYVLTQTRGECVDEIRVITTIAGRNKLLDVLLNPETGKFTEFCTDFGIARDSIKFDETTITLLRTPDGRMLEDIRTEEENEYAGDQICEIVRELTKDHDVRLHASAAGGRKTMSIYLTAAMQLFGRAQDSLSHVLVSEEFETNRDFFYKPPVLRTLEIKDRTGALKPVSTAEAQIYLASIPFIRLRGVKLDVRAMEPARGYVQMVKNAQADLDYIESEYDLQIDLTSDTVTVEKRSAQLTPREMFFYAMFADTRANTKAGDGSLSLDHLARADFDRIFRKIMTARTDNVGIEECTSFEQFAFLQEMIDQLASSLSRDRDDFKKKIVEINSRINRKLKDTGLPERYMITLRDERGSACYGLTVSPLRIKFAQHDA